MNNIGLAFFDKPDGLTESGWMVDGPDQLTRFSSLSVLDPSVIWFSNVKWDNDAYSTLRIKAPWARADNFFGFSLQALAKELAGSGTKQNIVLSLPAIHTVLTLLVEKLGLDFRQPKPLLTLVDKIELPTLAGKNGADIDRDFKTSPWVGSASNIDKSNGVKVAGAYQWRTYHWPRIEYYTSLLRLELPTGEWAETSAATPGRILKLDAVPGYPPANLLVPPYAGSFGVGARARAYYGEPEIQMCEGITPTATFGGELKRARAPLDTICPYSLVDALALEVCVRARANQLPLVSGWQSMAERMEMYARLRQLETQTTLDRRQIKVTGYGSGKVVFMCAPSDIPVMDRVMAGLGFEPPATYGERDLVAKLSPLSKLKAMGLPYMLAVDELLSKGLDMSSINGEMIRGQAESVLQQTEKLQENVMGWNNDAA